THRYCDTSWRTNVKRSRPKRCSMLSADPVIRLSTATTSSPASSSAWHRCEPRNPAPPVTTTRRPATSGATDALVHEPGAHPGGAVEQVAPVHELAGGHEAGDLLDV